MRNFEGQRLGGAASREDGGTVVTSSKKQNIERQTSKGSKKKEPQQKETEVTKRRAEGSATKDREKTKGEDVVGTSRPDPDWETFSPWDSP